MYCKPLILQYLAFMTNKPEWNAILLSTGIVNTCICSTNSKFLPLRRPTERVRPHATPTPRKMQAARAAFMIELEELFYPPADWTHAARERWFRTPGTHNDRVKIVLEFLSNGMPPMTLARWAALGWLRHQGSCDDMIQLMTEYAQGKHNKYEVIDYDSKAADRRMHVVVPHDGTLFAKAYPDQAPLFNHYTPGRGGECSGWGYMEEALTFLRELKPRLAPKY